MHLADLPAIPLDGIPMEVAEALGSSFRHYGFALVGDHGIEPALTRQTWRLTREFFALPETEKRQYFSAALAGARGYTPFGSENAKGAALPDLKEFWHIGRELPPGHPLTPSMPPNIWPDRPAGFRETYLNLYRQFDQVGAAILSRIALHLGLSPDWFEPAIADGNSVLRLLHYPPIAEAAQGAIRAGAHEDINLITLLLGEEEAGLELLGPDGEWLAVSPPEGALVVNIGDMLQRLTNHELPSTTHRVRNPLAERASFSRYAMPFFLHPRSDFEIKTLRECITPKNPDRYPRPIAADAYLQERLKEIGLKK